MLVILYVFQKVQVNHFNEWKGSLSIHALYSIKFVWDVVYSLFNLLPKLEKVLVNRLSLLQEIADACIHQSFEWWQVLLCSEKVL